MNKTRFWLAFLGLNLLFVFVKIYQHNLFTNTLFKKQKLISKQNLVSLEINQLEKTLYSLKNKHNLLTKAQTDFGFVPLNTKHFQKLNVV